MTKKKTWPHAPNARTPDEDIPRTCVEDVSEVPMTTQCKHGLGECETCGTTNRRDVIHSTRGGVGLVGKLRKPCKK